MLRKKLSGSNFLILLICFAIVSACKKEAKPVSIVGKWNSAEVIIRTYQNDKDLTDTDVSKGEDAFEFRADGTGTYTLRGTANSIKYTYDGTTFKASMLFKSDDPIYANLTNTFIPMFEYTVKELTASKLVFISGKSYTNNYIKGTWFTYISEYTYTR